MSIDAPTLRWVGVVHSPVKETREMPAEGVEAEIEVFPEGVPGLVEIELNSHLIVLGWFDLAGRDVSQVGPPGRGRGVFGLRAAARPNPVGLAVCRLLGRTDNKLRVADLDFVEGTLIVDLKRYSPSWDCVFSARTSRDQRVGDLSEDQVEEAIREAAAFHGELCEGVIAGSRLMLSTTAAWRVPRKSPEFTVQVNGDGCLADTLQALSGATFGSGRLAMSAEGAPAALLAPGRRFRFQRLAGADSVHGDVRFAPLETLFNFWDPAP